jgi:predicted CXXCH cytochrome family protein
MRRPALAIAIFSATYVVALVAQAPASPKPESEYIGSAACRSCHEAAYDSWNKTLHVQMTRPIAEARVEGDFRRGTRLEQNGRSYAMDTRNGRYFVSVAHGARPAEQYEVNYTLGARRFQGYLSKLPDGRIYVLPIFWHNEAKRWVDWKEITPIPDDPNHDLRQIWNVTCINCHATNLAKNFDPQTKTYNTTWTEMGIACEACHGPGGAHAANPPKNIFAPSKADTRQVFDMCAYCHGNKNNVFYGFKPGDRYEDFAMPFLVGQPIPDNDPQGDFWPDGRPSRFNRPQALTLTGCFRSGEATCTSCHRMHGSTNSHSLKVEVDLPGGGHTKQSDTLCTQCHTEPGGSIGSSGSGRSAGSRGWEAHTHHADDSQGSRCVGCHMSEVNWRMITRRRDHTFQPPVPEMTARFGAPNACTTCHEDKTPEWAAATMNVWYANGDKRRAIAVMGDTLYRAGAGDAAVLPDVARLAADRSHGMLIRASAAELAGQLIEKSGGSPVSGGSGGSGGATVARGFSPAVNALIGAAADPEPAVRITAVRALSAVGDRRLAPVLAAHLTDEARVARVSAAEGLLNLGMTQLEGAQGAALARAQDEWATSLRFFNDVAADTATLGWLDASRGRSEEATKEFQTAIALDPTDARPHVYLGLLAARRGQYAEALQHLKTAQLISPLYNGLDRFIEQVSKLLSKHH